MDSKIEDWKPTALKYDGNCVSCGVRLKRGSLSLWSPSRHFIACLSHKGVDIPLASPPVTRVSQEVPVEVNESMSLGIPGGSARKMDEKRKRRIRMEMEDDRIKEQYGAEHPKVTRVMKIVEKNFPRWIEWARRELNDSYEPSSWSKGAEGEEIVGRELEELSRARGFITIHDRSIPGSPANIDHIVITSSKVFVVDTKYYVHKIDVGKLLAPYFGRKAILKIDGRNRNKLLEDVEKQVRVVKQVLEKAEIHIPVQGALAFVKAKWDMPSFLWPRSINGVLLNSRGLPSMFRSVPLVDPEIVLKIAMRLREDLPPHK